jgi:hypothetical protein
MSKAHVISDAECDEWTENWRALASDSEPYTFFKPDGRVQTGVIFPFGTLRYLFSAVGVTTVRVRFGLRRFTDGRPPQFHLILFGVGATGPHGEVQTLTPYFTSSSFTHHHHYAQDSQAQGNLPMALMKGWKKSWFRKVMKDRIGSQMFTVNPQLLSPPAPPAEDSFLRGYSYSITEMMQALGRFKGAANIHFKFGLHKYYSLLPTPDAPLTHFYTFGLILYAATKAQPGPDSRLFSQQDSSSARASDGSEVIDDSGYYDFSAPCPYTC